MVESRTGRWTRETRERNKYSRKKRRVLCLEAGFNKALEHMQRDDAARACEPGYHGLAMLHLKRLELSTCLQSKFSSIGLWWFMFREWNLELLHAHFRGGNFHRHFTGQTWHHVKRTCAMFPCRCRVNEGHPSITHTRHSRQDRKVYQDEENRGFCDISTG
jgi:hypothetical protein